MNLRKPRGLRVESLESRKMFAVAAGDFNGDGIGDMAYGVPGEDVTVPLSFANQVDAGAVNVVYGSNSYTGLRTTGNELLTQGGQATSDDHFGSALAAGEAVARDAGDGAGAGVASATLAAAQVAMSGHAASQHDGSAASTASAS